MPSSSEKKSPSPIEGSAQNITKQSKRNTHRIKISLEQHLMTAVIQKRHQEVFLCLEAGANPDIRQSAGLTPLMIAAYAQDLTNLTYLVNHEADTNLRSPRGETALYLSALQGQYAAAEWLLRHKADPNVPTFEGNTPLGAAICEHAHSRLPELYEQTVKTLLQGKGDPNQPHLGFPPLWLAARQGSQALVSLLLEAESIVLKATATLGNKDESSATFTAIEAARESGYEPIARQLEHALRQQAALALRKAPAKSNTSKTMKPALSILTSNNIEKPRAKMKVGTVSEAASTVSDGVENIKW